MLWKLSNKAKQIYYISFLKGIGKPPGTVQDAVKSSEKLFTDLFNFSIEHRYVMEMIFKGIESEESVQRVIMETRLKVEEALKNNIQRAMDLNILPKQDPSLTVCIIDEFI